MAQKRFSLPSAIARKLAASRQKKTRKCLYCGKAFMTVGRGLYCSDQCKQKQKYRLMRQRLKDKATAAADA